MIYLYLAIVPGAPLTLKMAVDVETRELRSPGPAGLDRKLKKESMVENPNSP